MLRAKASDECDDEGAAVLEFLLAGLVLLVPIVYLIVALGLIQSHALGVEAAARHTARAVATATGDADADVRGQRVLAAVAAEYDIDTETIAVSLACTGTASRCPEAGTTTVVTVTASVALPLVPPVLGLDRLARVPVEARAVHKVSRFWGHG